MLYGGSIAPGRWRGKDVTIQDVFEGIGAHAAGDLSRRRAARPREPRQPGRRRLRRAVHRQHDGDGVRGARHLADGQLDGAGRGRQEGPGGARTAAGSCSRWPSAASRPRGSSRGSRSRTRSPPGAMSGGSTNLVLHLLAVAHEAGVELELEDFDRIAWGTPLLCDLKPGGRYVATDLYRAGGVPLVIRRLKEAGLLHEDALTVTGQTIGEVAAAAEEAPGPGRGAARVRAAQAERRLRDPARQPGAGGLRGQAVGPRPHGAPRPGARVRARGGRLRRGDGQVDPAGRGRGDPQRGPERRSRDARDAARDRRARGGGPRRLGRAAHRRPLLGRHARLHGRPRGARGPPRRARSRRCATATRSCSTWPPAS